MPTIPDLESLSQRYKLVATEVSVAQRTFEIWKPDNIDDLINEAEFDADERLPYWAEVWPSGRVLAEQLAGRPADGRRLLELGCGLGLVSLLARWIGFDVLATDYYEPALEFTAFNAAHNAIPPVATRLLDWRKLPDDLGSFDLIVAGDVLYERPNSALVANVLDRCLAPEGLALVTDPSRRVAGQFPDLCAERRLKVERIARLEVVP